MSATGVSKQEHDKLELINAVLRDKDREQVKKLINSGINVNDIFVPGVNGPNTCLIRQAIHYGDLPGAPFEEISIAYNLIIACSKETIEILKELEVKQRLLKFGMQCRLTQKETPEQETIKIESKESEVENIVVEETVAAESKPILAFQHDAEKASKRESGHSVKGAIMTAFGPSKENHYAKNKQECLNDFQIKALDSYISYGKYWLDEALRTQKIEILTENGMFRTRSKMAIDCIKPNNDSLVEALEYIYKKLRWGSDEQRILSLVLRIKLIQATNDGEEPPVATADARVLDIYNEINKSLVNALALHKSGQEVERLLFNLRAEKAKVLKGDFAKVKLRLQNVQKILKDDHKGLENMDKAELDNLIEKNNEQSCLLDLEGYLLRSLEVDYMKKFGIDDTEMQDDLKRMYRDIDDLKCEIREYFTQIYAIKSDNHSYAIRRR